MLQSFALVVVVVAVGLRVWLNMWGGGGALIDQRVMLRGFGLKVLL